MYLSNTLTLYTGKVSVLFRLQREVQRFYLVFPLTLKNPLIRDDKNIIPRSVPFSDNLKTGMGTHNSCVAGEFEPLQSEVN